MATSPEIHQPVSNEPPEEPGTTARGASLPIEPASAGDNPDIAPARDGVEAVADYRLPTRDRPSVVVVDPELRDIGEASFGPPKTGRAVIGTDDRVQINNTGQYPFSAVASLLITARDDSQWIGTGWFIGPKTLATAGHCVYIKNSPVPGRDGWVKSITVIPGRNGTTQPFGFATTWRVRTVQGWIDTGDENVDYGAIILDTELGRRTGWLGFGVYADADLQAAIANVSGYPGDKPTGTNWFHARRVQSVNARKVYYDVDTAGGQSGAPVWRDVNGARMGMAIHAYGGGTANSGTRINQAVFNNLLAWKSA